MDSFFRFFERMNLLVWGLGLFLAHAIMYFMMGTRTWLTTALLAAAVWTGVLFIVKAVAKRYVTNRNREPY